MIFEKTFETDLLGVSRTYNNIWTKVEIMRQTVKAIKIMHFNSV